MVVGADGVDWSQLFEEIESTLYLVVGNCRANALVNCGNADRMVSGRRIGFKVGKNEMPEAVGFDAFKRSGATEGGATEKNWVYAIFAGTGFSAGLE